MKTDKTCNTENSKDEHQGPTKNPEHQGSTKNRELTRVFANDVILGSTMKNIIKLLAFPTCKV